MTYFFFVKVSLRSRKKAANHRLITCRFRTSMTSCESRWSSPNLLFYPRKLNIWAVFLRGILIISFWCWWNSFLGDWFPSDSHVVKSSGMDFSSSSSSLPLSPFSLPSNTNSNSFSGSFQNFSLLVYWIESSKLKPCNNVGPCGFKSDVAGERGGGDDEDASMKTMGVNNGEVQFNGSQAVSVTVSLILAI